MSAIVRAMASALRGSLDGVLMMASDRATALRRIDNAAITGLLPAMTCTVRAPMARMLATRPSSIRRGTQPSRYGAPIASAS